MAEIDWDDDEVKAALDERIQAAISEASKEFEKTTEGLRNKNKELLGKVKSSETALKVFDGLDPDEIKDSLDRLAELEEKADGGDGGEATKTAVQSALERANRKAEREQKRLEEQLTEVNEELVVAKTQGRKLLVDVALDAAMDEAEIATPYRKAVRLMHGEQVGTMLDDEDESSRDAAARIASQVLKGFASSPEGKHFVAAPDSSGGGANGAAAGGKGLPEEAKYFDPSHAEHNVTKQGEIFNRDQALYTRLYEHFNASDL